MINLPLPKSPHEKALEIKMLQLIMQCVKEDMPFIDILMVIERVRHITTEIMVETEND